MIEENIDLKLRREVLLSFQVALLGMVGPNLRGVTISWSDRNITGHLLFTGEVGIEEKESAADIEAEVSANFPNHDVEVTARRTDFPEPINDYGLTAWVYRRKE